MYLLFNVDELLAAAARTGDIAMFEENLDISLLHKKDGANRNILHIAAAYTQPEILKRILNLDASLLLETSNGKTLLHLAAEAKYKEKDSLDCIRILLEFNADLNQRDFEGNLPQSSFSKVQEYLRKSRFFIQNRDEIASDDDDE